MLAWLLLNFWPADVPTLASQSAGVTGVSHRPGHSWKSPTDCIITSFGCLSKPKPLTTPSRTDHSPSYFCHCFYPIIALCYNYLFIGLFLLLVCEFLIGSGYDCLFFRRETFLILFLRQSLALSPDWSAVAWSQLTATSASRVQGIPLPRPPEWLGWQACTTMPD